LGIRDALRVVSEMEATGIIGRYAICGALAAYNYVEPANTEDVAVLILGSEGSDHSTTGLLSLAPILKYLAARGFDRFQKEGIVIGGWPVQFLPVANALDEEALAEADMIELFGQPGSKSLRVRVMRPEHLVASALRVGRPKDALRIIQFLDEEAVDPSRLHDVLSRHGLIEKWRAFVLRSGGVNAMYDFSKGDG
jgi:hypothetical protein